MELHRPRGRRERGLHRQGVRREVRRGGGVSLVHKEVGGGGNLNSADWMSEYR